ELAVYNHDLDREIKEFSLPVPVGTVLQGVGFRDVDQDGGNQWTDSFSGGVLKWTMGTTNTIKYSNVFNFWFDADMPPANASATLKQFKAGSAGDLAAVTRGPVVLTPVSSYTIVNATPLAGNLQSLALRDADRLSLTPILTSSLL